MSKYTEDLDQNLKLPTWKDLQKNNAAMLFKTNSTYANIPINNWPAFTEDVHYEMINGKPFRPAANEDGNLRIFDTAFVRDQNNNIKAPYNQYNFYQHPFNGTMFGPNPNFDGQYENQLIKNLGLNLEMAWTGDGATFIKKISDMWDAKENIMVYYWEPEAIFSAASKYSFHRVSLPPYNDECYTKRVSGGVDCDYPQEILYKVLT